MGIGYSRRGTWVSIPFWAWVVFGPFIAYVWLMWLVVKWGGTGLYWLMVWNVRFLRWATPRAVHLARTGLARWQHRRAIPAGHP